ncbi:MAG TPA: Crp/Fnr family transcriptional regulator [Telluria sp.]|nr:Crp/Fnr family transcriptional regulator [Telluria sp.]
MNFAAVPQVAEHNANLLLAALPPDEMASMLPLLDPVQVEAGDVLSEPGDPISHIYFPHDCLLSLLAVAEGRMTLEVGLVGREGMLGATVALGHETSQVRAVVQRAGSASRMETAAFRAEFGRNPLLQKVIARYTDSLLAQAIQIAVCSRFHVLEARLARSLLVTRDRLRSDKFHLTHEFLAHALGVRRVGVTKAASALQEQGLIVYSRGNIEILDAEGLAAASCTCYEIVKEAGTAAGLPVFV